MAGNAYFKIDKGLLGATIFAKSLNPKTQRDPLIPNVVLAKARGDNLNIREFKSAAISSEKCRAVFLECRVNWCDCPYGGF